MPLSLRGNSEVAPNGLPYAIGPLGAPFNQEREDRLADYQDREHCAAVEHHLRTLDQLRGVESREATDNAARVPSLSRGAAAVEPGAGRALAREDTGDEPPRFHVPTCVCGHAIGDHKSAGTYFPHPPRYGPCFQCNCREYWEKPRDDDPKGSAA